MHAGPVIIGFDGTPASVGAVRESADLIGPRAAPGPVVVCGVTRPETG
jgi:hypothetical protein